MPPRREVLGGRIGAVFDRIRGTVTALERLTGIRSVPWRRPSKASKTKWNAMRPRSKKAPNPRIFAGLSEIDADSENEAGSKAAVLGEIRNRAGPAGSRRLRPDHGSLPPITAAFRSGGRSAMPRATRPERSAGVGARLASRSRGVHWTPCCRRAVEIGIAEGAARCSAKASTLAVRSSARGEGNARSYAGQFLSLLNVPAGRQWTPIGR